MTVNSSLVAAFQRVESRPRETLLPENVLLAEQVSKLPTTYATCSANGHRGLVVPSQAGIRIPPAVRLRALSVTYGAQYMLSDGEDTEQVRAALITCTSDAPAVQALFGNFCEAFIASLTADPDDLDVEKQVSLWTNLFLRLERSARKTAIGIAGELTLIRSWPSLDSAVSAWHHDTHGTFDFTFPSLETIIEVKATGGVARKHHVSLDQLVASSAHPVLFASMFIRNIDNGTTIADLADAISMGLEDPRNREEFWLKLVDVAGEEWPSISRFKFDIVDALDSVSYISRESIPHPEIRLPLPEGVASVTFLSDFSRASTQRPPFLTSKP